MPSHTRPGANGEQNRRFERPAEKQFRMGGSRGRLRRSCIRVSKASVTQPSANEW